MTSREQLIRELETLPEPLINEVFDYIDSLKNRYGVQHNKSMPAGFDEKWWNNLTQFTPDFLGDREQPLLPTRENIFP